MVAILCLVANDRRFCFIYIHVRGLSVKFVDTANKTRTVYHRLMKFCINKYQLSGTIKTQYDSLFLTID